MDVIAISESTPGPFAVNMATFVGSKTAGNLGAFFATFGVVLPSFLMLVLLSQLLSAFESNPYVALAFQGIRAGVVVLIFNALVSMYKSLAKNTFNYVMIALSFILVYFCGLSSILVLILAACIGGLKK